MPRIKPRHDEMGSEEVVSLALESRKPLGSYVREGSRELEKSRARRRVAWGMASERLT